MDASPAFLDVYAPLSGVRVPLARVPDPVFAQRMVGDGAALDPLSDCVLAPVDGEVVQLHASRHALTLRTDQGIDVLVHVGIDTVQLRGEGFEVAVAVGDRVRRGQSLIRFDLDAVAGRARSLLTLVVVANGERVAALELGRGDLVAGESVLFRLRLQAAAAAAEGAGNAQTLAVGYALLPNPNGLHARPAAVLAEAARRFHSETHLRCGGRVANARSVVALLALGCGCGDEVGVEARGADAQAARDALIALLLAGCGDVLDGSDMVAAVPAATTDVGGTAGQAGAWAGVAASPGVAIGRIRHWRRSRLQVAERGDTPALETRRLQQALQQARADLAALQAELGAGPRAGILEAHRALLEDPELVDSALAGIDQGQSAGHAWQVAFERHAAVLAALPNPLLRERASDLRDVGERVLRLLAGVVAPSIEVPPESILVAEELGPSDTAGLDPRRVRGLCTVGGGPTGHVAILARALGIPALCGMPMGILGLGEGELAIIDGAVGSLQVAPEGAQVAAAEAAMQVMARQHAEQAAQAQAPARTRDGTRIEVVANVRHAADTEQAVAAGAEGVGLLRSEFLFEDRSDAPGEDEQYQAYAAVAAELGPSRPLVVRTLDVGGDKPLPYLPLPEEANPFLGLRGIRVSLAQPQLFRQQLRALLRCAASVQLQVMLPMVALVEELRAARALLQAEAEALGVAPPPLGVMIEVPSAALIADVLASEADFFSIGSNDLTQYALAMDRGHARLAAQADALHPAVLRLIAMSCEAAQRHGRWVGLCGALASDPLATPLLLGLGITELSVSTPAIAAVKAAVARCDLDACRALAAQALQLESAAAVRARLATFSAA